MGGGGGIFPRSGGGGGIFEGGLEASLLTDRYPSQMNPFFLFLVRLPTSFEALEKNCELRLSTASSFSQIAF
jgi:hypothetical protein